MHDTLATMITSRRSNRACVAACRSRSISSLRRRVLLDVRVAAGQVRLGLVVVEVADEVLDGVVREELAELRVQLRGERLVVGEHERRLVVRRDDRGEREGLARARWPPAASGGGGPSARPAFRRSIAPGWSPVGWNGATRSKSGTWNRRIATDRLGTDTFDTSRRSDSGMVRPANARTNAGALGTMEDARFRHDRMRCSRDTRDGGPSAACAWRRWSPGGRRWMPDDRIVERGPARRRERRRARRWSNSPSSCRSFISPDDGRHRVRVPVQQPPDRPVRRAPGCRAPRRRPAPWTAPTARSSTPSRTRSRSPVDKDRSRRRRDLPVGHRG